MLELGERPFQPLGRMLGLGEWESFQPLERMKGLGMGTFSGTQAMQCKHILALLSGSKGFPAHYNSNVFMHFFRHFFKGSSSSFKYQFCKAVLNSSAFSLPIVRIPFPVVIKILLATMVDVLLFPSMKSLS